MRPDAEARVVRLADAETASFGRLAEYQPLTGDDGLPVFTAVQTCRPAAPRRCAGIPMWHEAETVASLRRAHADDTVQKCPGGAVWGEFCSGVAEKARY